MGEKRVDVQMCAIQQAHLVGLLSGLAKKIFGYSIPLKKKKKALSIQKSIVNQTAVEY